MGKEVTSLPWVHAAYHEFKNRLQNLSRMISMEPQLAQVLRVNTHAREGDELVSITGKLHWGVGKTLCSIPAALES
jgi:DNA polymerase II small subunit/DNA polymerase delta subunit B